MTDVARFFDAFKDKYTEAIQRSNPCYAEMLEATFNYLPSDWKAEST